MIQREPPADCHQSNDDLKLTSPRVKGGPDESLAPNWSSGETGSERPDEGRGILHFAPFVLQCEEEDTR